MKHIPTFESFLNEGKNNFSIEKDFPVDSLIYFNDGEVWKVIKTGGKQQGSKKPNEILIRPENPLAKQKNTSVDIAVDLDYLNKNVTKVTNESEELTEGIKVELADKKMVDLKKGDKLVLIAAAKDEYKKTKPNMKGVLDDEFTFDSLAGGALRVIGSDGDSYILDGSRFEKK